MVAVLAAPQQAKTDASLRTLAAISTAHWVSHFHMFVPPMLFPFLKEQLGVGYIELGFAMTVFGVVSGLTQAPIGYLADHIGARKVLLIGLTLGGSALIMLGLHLSYPWLIASAVLLGRQQRLSSGRLCDPFGTHGRGAHGTRLFDPYLCRLSRRRGRARDRGGTCCNDRGPWRPDRGRRSGSAGGAAARRGRHSRRQRGGPSRQRRESATAKHRDADDHGAY